MITQILKTIYYIGIYLGILATITIIIALIWEKLKRTYLKECPICKELIEKDKTTCKNCENKKPCPFCKEYINKEATKCPKCQSELKI